MLAPRVAVTPAALALAAPAAAAARMLSLRALGRRKAPPARLLLARSLVLARSLTRRCEGSRSAVRRRAPLLTRTLTLALTLTLTLTLAPSPSRTKNLLLVRTLDNVKSKVAFWKYDADNGWVLFSEEASPRAAGIGLRAVDDDESDECWLTTSSYTQPSSLSLIGA